MCGGMGPKVRETSSTSKSEYSLFFQRNIEKEKAKRIANEHGGVLRFSRMTTQLHRHLVSRDHSNPCPPISPATVVHGGRNASHRMSSCPITLGKLTSCRKKKRVVPVVGPNTAFSDNQGHMGAPHPAGLCTPALGMPAIHILISMRILLFSTPRVCNVYKERLV